MKKKIITLAGKPGSGKSSTGKGVAERLGYKHYSGGDLMRKIAKKHEVTVNEINRRAEEEDLSIDEEIDGENKRLGNENEIIIDARVAYHFIPESFKVYLDLDLAISAERVCKDQTTARHTSGEAVSSPEELKKLLEVRLESEYKRYKEKYGTDPSDLSQYDLVINTNDHPLEEVIEIILTEYEKWLAA